MNKRGQFYIVAAILIVLVLSGVTGVSTYTVVKSEPKTIYELGSDLNRESAKIIEYGIYNNKDLTELTNEFAGKDVAKYFLKKTNNANIIFVYGNKTNLQSLQYNTVSIGDINVAGAGWEDYGSYSEIRELENDGEFAKVEVLNKEYSFDLKDNEMFYFVIVQKRGDETFVEKSDGE